MPNDFISREAALNLAKNHTNRMIDMNDIARIPAAAVAQVVRCGSCKHHHTESTAKPWGYCSVLDAQTKITFWCKNGDRIDGGEHHAD